MKKIAIIYTVRPVLESFAPALEKKPAEDAEKISGIPVVGSIDLCHDSIVEMIKELP